MAQDKAGKEDGSQTMQPVRKAQPERKAEFKTPSGIPLPARLTAAEPILGLPGEIGLAG